MAPDLDALLTRVATGDDLAFGEFYSHTAERVHGMALRVARDPGFSEEITQEVYLTVWQTAPRFDASAGSALAWLLTMAHRRAVDRVRSESASRRRGITYGLSAVGGRYDDDAAITVENRETAREVRALLAVLTPLQRESVELAFLHGLSYREVATRLNVALPTVKTRIRDGLGRMRHSLAAPAA